MTPLDATRLKDCVYLHTRLQSRYRAYGGGQPHFQHKVQREADRELLRRALLTWI